MTLTPGHSPALTLKDGLRLAGLAGFAVVLLAPLRHYVGDMPTVTTAKNERDSFPLSTYPMFSADRQGRVTVPHVVGITAEGGRIQPHHRHYGPGGLNQVRRQISREIRQGRATEIAQTYADSLAAQARTEEEADIVEVKVVRARYLFADYFAGAQVPQAESVHATCEVGGRAKPGPGKALPKLERISNATV